MAEAQVEEQVSEQVEQETQETEIDTSNLKPNEGRKPVEFENPETEARFKRVYFSMKQNERISEKMAADNAKLVERIEKMEGEREQETSQNRISELKATERAALEEGDHEKASEARDRITDLKVDSKIPKPKVVEEEDWLTPERESYIAEWAGQKDDKGNLARPWADPEHEDHAKMVALADDFIKKHPNTTLPNLLDHWEIEARKHAPRPTRTAASVLPGGSDVRPKAKAAALSEDEKIIVKRMYPKLPPKDAEARYRASKEKYL